MLSQSGKWHVVSNAAAGPSGSKRVRVEEPTLPSLSFEADPFDRQPTLLQFPGPLNIPTAPVDLEAEIFARRSSIALFNAMTRYTQAMVAMAAKELTELLEAAKKAEELRKRQESKGKGKEKERN